MKKNLTALVASLLLLASCSDEAPVNPVSEDAIAFGTVSATRGAVTSADEIQDFKVYAKKFTVAPFKESEGFWPEPQVVTRQTNNQWTYPDKAYWQSGYTYSFLSLYPSTIDAKESISEVNGNVEHYLTIENYSVGKDEDLMMGINPNIEVTKESIPGTVNVKFQHLLSQVDFVVKADAETEALIGDVIVTEATFYGTHTTGSYSGKTFTADGTNKGTWSFSEDPTTVDNPTIRKEKVEVTTDGVQLFGKSFILYPGKEPAKIKVTYKIGNDPTVFTYEQDLSLITPLGWEAGKSYRYTVTIVDKEHILFDVPTVQSWSKGTGGIIIVE